MAYTHIHRMGWRLLFAVLGVLALAGCSHSVKVEPQMQPRNTHQFVNVVFVEGEHNPDVPKELEENMDRELKNLTATGNVFFKGGLAARKKRGDKHLQTMTVEWKVVKFDPGNYWTHRFLWMFHAGVGSIEVEAKFMDASKHVLGKVKNTSSVDPKPSAWLTYQNLGRMQWQAFSTYFTDNYYKPYD